MQRYMRNTLLRAKIETTYGTPDGPWVGADAILLRNARFRIDRDVVPRDLILGYFGGSEHLIGTRRAEIEFEVELAGSGAAGTAPAWGKLLRACGMAEVVTAGQRVEYTPVTTGQESLTLEYIIDGVRYISRGARGNARFVMTAYSLPVIQFRFWGFDTNALAQSASGTFTNWKRGFVITDANSADIRLGGSYNAGTISGGTAMPSRGMEFDLNNTLSHIKLLGGESIDITGRDVMGRMSVALSAADEITWRDAINANALTSMSFSIGNESGNTINLFAPSVQRVDPQAEDYEGRQMVATELRLLPTGNGNNEIRVIVR
jgi:hypothetical protein